MITKTLLLLGDEVENTALLGLYDTGKQFNFLDFASFPNLCDSAKIPNIVVKTMTIDGENYRVEIKDFSRRMWNYDAERFCELVNLSCYDVFIVAFSVFEPRKFKTVKKRWIPKLKQHYPDTPIILVGNKTNRRSNSKRLITTEKGYKFARKINAAKYLECSYENEIRVRNIFYEAVWATLGPIPDYCNKLDPHPKCCDVS